MASSIDMEKHQKYLIAKAMGAGALKFGSYKLKSGRVSPYFFNAALMNTGHLVDVLASAYAALIASSLQSSAIPQFDVIFGPAYKGIPLAACVALILSRDHGIYVSWGYDRKEAKTHGEGGVLVGADVAGKRVLILDDVITAGTAIREALDKIGNVGGHVIGVVVCLDREEVGTDVDPSHPESRSSTVDQVAKQIDGPVRAIIRMRDLMSWLSGHGHVQDFDAMEAYWRKYGIGSK